MKVLLILFVALAALCWGLYLLADWFIGKVEHTPPPEGQPRWPIPPGRDPNRRRAL